MRVVRARHLGSMDDSHHRATITLRRASGEDAGRIIEVHHAAVRGTAAAFYESAVIDDWAPAPITPGHVRPLAERIEEGEEVVVVATAPDGQVVGFGSVVPPRSELRAVYVLPSRGRRGVGTRILRRLEELAREAGAVELHLDASVNAEAFYRRHGYAEEGRGEHVLRTGRRMTCVRMRKSLSAG